MFRFENIDMLWALWGIPVFISIFIIYRYSRSRSLKRLGDEHLISQLIPEASKFKLIGKFVIYLLIYSLLVLSSAKPQIGTKMEKVKRRGVELIVALDISNSMRAEDIKPSRLERAKQSISKLTDQLKGDKIGIVIFAGDAYLLLPVTADYSAAKMMISSVVPNLIDNQGTALGNAIEIASRSFSKKDKISKALIIISDGENHEDDALAAAKSIAEKGVKIFSVGMGTPNGAPIPHYDNFGRPSGYKKDESGNTIITKLNPNILEEIASVGDGEFTYANNMGVDLNEILNKISGLKKNEYGAKIYTDFDNKYQFFLLPAIILLILELLISDKRNKYLAKLSDFASGNQGGKND